MTTFEFVLLGILAFAIVILIVWFIGNAISINMIDEKLIEIESLIKFCNPDEPKPIRDALDRMDVSKLNTEQSLKWLQLWKAYYQKFPAQKR